MKHLLNEKNNKYFQEEYPMFFKNKLSKLNNPNKNFYRSPIENAMINNQIGAIEVMM